MWKNETGIPSFSRSRAAVFLLTGGATPEEIIADARNAEFDGADGIAVELGKLPPEFRTEEQFRRMMNEVRLPFMFILYRNDQWLGGKDEERQSFLLDAARAGADVIDVMGDLYDPSPFELTHDPAAVAKQEKLIEQIHSLGARVVMSSHMGQARSAEEVLEHLRCQEKRGADIVKIVTGVNSEEEFLEAIRTTLLLKREMKTPFIHLCNGSWSRQHRFLGAVSGCSVVFGVHEYRAASLMTQPTIRSLKTFMNHLPC